MTLLSSFVRRLKAARQNAEIDGIGARLIGDNVGLQSVFGVCAKCLTCRTLNLGGVRRAIASRAIGSITDVELRAGGGCENNRNASA